MEAEATPDPDVAEILAALTDLCANQCRALCCRDNVLWLTDAEIAELWPEEQTAQTWRFTGSNGEWTAEAVTGGFVKMAPCRYLDLETSLCRVYDRRPKACRVFPTGPTPGCLIWPGEGEPTLRPRTQP